MSRHSIAALVIVSTAFIGLAAITKDYRLALVAWGILIVGYIWE